jgi:uncharacterized protein YutE (UPF0331/DUF86 family)
LTNLKKLFKFKPKIVEKDEEVDEEKIMNDFIENLHSFHDTIKTINVCPFY